MWRGLQAILKILAFSVGQMESQWRILTRGKCDLRFKTISLEINNEQPPSIEHLLCVSHHGKASLWALAH